VLANTRPTRCKHVRAQHLSRLGLMLLRP